MAFEKKIASQHMGVIKSNPSSPDELFPVGSRFIYDGSEYRVTKLFKEDNTHMRKCASTTGTNEIIPLFSLMKDLQAGTIQFIKDDKSEGKAK